MQTLPKATMREAESMCMGVYRSISALGCVHHTEVLPGPVCVQGLALPS